MTVLITTNGVAFSIDDDDLERVSTCSWTFTNGYVYGALRVGRKGVQHGVRRRPANKFTLQAFLMGFPQGMDVDHRDMDHTNNQKYNLRVATRSQNMANSKSRGGTSRFKGVHKNKERGHKHWTARITVNGKGRFIGNFHAEEEAALAYNREALIHFGEFARLNEVDAPDRKEREAMIPEGVLAE